MNNPNVPPEVRAEMERIQEEEFGRILNPALPAIHYTRQFLLDMILEIRRETFAEETRRSIAYDHPLRQIPLHVRCQENFQNVLLERSGQIMDMTKLVFGLMDDPAKAFHDIREPKRLEEQEARARAIAAKKADELSAEFEREVRAKQASIRADIEAAADKAKAKTMKDSN